MLRGNQFHLSSSSSSSSVCEKGAVSDALRVVSKRAFAPSGCINVEAGLRRSVYSAGDATARVGWVQVGCVAMMGGFGSGLLLSRDDFQAGVAGCCFLPRALLICSPNKVWRQPANLRALALKLPPSRHAGSGLLV
jgi:hypothetical protein